MKHPTILQKGKQGYIEKSVPNGEGYFNTDIL